MTEQWTEADIPDQTGRVALVTGANSGIGYEAARALAQQGADVVLGCRSLDKAKEALAAIEETDPSGKLEILELDLADLDSVEKAAETFTRSHDRLDLLVNNAGLMATPEQRTAQGFEMQFGVNHLGHFALTEHLLPLLLATDDSRVVSVSSQGHRMGKINFDDLNGEQKYRAWPAYFQSKLANLLFTLELQRRLADAEVSTIAVTAHPGGSRTNLGNEPSGDVLSKVFGLFRPVMDRLMSQSAEKGALPTLRAATDPDVAAGDYYGPDGFMEGTGHPVNVDSSSRAKDRNTARRLWEVSEDLTGVSYDALDTTNRS